MATTVDILLHSAIILCSVQYCSAFCHGYCWYGSWYIWFAVVMILAICCGAVGSYFRRRQIRKALRNQQTQIVTVDITGQNRTVTSDNTRPYVGPPGSAPYPNQAGAALYAGGTAPYPTQPISPPYSAGGAPPYPAQAGAAPYPTGGEPYPPNGAYPGGAMHAAPPYSAITNKDEKFGSLPPSYQEAIASHGGYANPAATVADSDVTSRT